MHDCTQLARGKQQLERGRWQLETGRQQLERGRHVWSCKKGMQYQRDESNWNSAVWFIQQFFRFISKKLYYIWHLICFEQHHFCVRMIQNIQTLKQLWEIWYCLCIQAIVPATLRCATPSATCQSSRLTPPLPQGTPPDYACCIQCGGLSPDPGGSCMCGSCPTGPLCQPETFNHFIEFYSTTLLTGSTTSNRNKCTESVEITS